MVEFMAQKAKRDKKSGSAGAAIAAETELNPAEAVDSELSRDEKALLRNVRAQVAELLANRSSEAVTAPAKGTAPPPIPARPNAALKGDRKTTARVIAVTKISGSSLEPQIITKTVSTTPKPQAGAAEELLHPSEVTVHSNRHQAPDPHLHSDPDPDPDPECCAEHQHVGKGLQTQPHAQDSEADSELATVLYDYVGHGVEGHVEVLTCDQVIVESKTADWWLVRLAAPARSGPQEGWMPAAFVQMAASSVSATETQPEQKAAKSIPDCVGGTESSSNLEIEIERQSDAKSELDSQLQAEVPPRQVRSSQPELKEKETQHAVLLSSGEQASPMDPRSDDVVHETTGEKADPTAEPTIDPKPDSEPWIVLYDYASHGSDDHVEVFRGEVVLVQLRPSPDWWYVETTDATRAGGVQKGWMPAAFLDVAPKPAGSLASGQIEDQEHQTWVAEEDLSDEDLADQVPPFALDLSAEEHAEAVTHEPETLTIQRIQRGRLTRARVKKIKKKEYQRRRIVMEILSTEQTYNEGLRVMNQEFLTQLRWKCQQAAATASKDARKKKSSRRMSVIQANLEFPTLEDVNLMFGNVPGLHALSDQLISLLTPRVGELPQISAWSPHQKIGDIFIKIGPFFKIYKDYCRSFDAASTKLQECREGYPAFNMLLNNLREVHKLDCSSFLIMPIQRIPRYKMLLEEITKATRPEHNDYGDLCKAAALVGSVAKDVNNHINEMECKDYLVQLSKEIEGMPFELVSASRTFVLEATLEMKFSGSEESAPFRFILCNDMIVYCSRSTEETRANVTHTYEGSMPLSRGARLKKLPMMKNWAYGFTVVCNNRSYTLGCRSKEELDRMLEAINGQVTAMQTGSWDGAWVDVLGTEDRTAANSSKTYTVYKIELQLAESLLRKTIYKRYSEFVTLDQTIRDSPENRGARFPELPPKHMIKMFRTKGMNEKVIELRRVALESYLSELVSDVNLRSDDALRMFLEEEAPIPWASEESRKFQSTGALLASKIEACEQAIAQLSTTGTDLDVDSERLRLKSQLKQLQDEQASLFRVPKPTLSAEGRAVQEAILAAREEIENEEQKSQRVMIETADGGWSLRFFSLQARALSIFETPNARDPIAVIPAELCMTRNPKSKRDDAPHAFRMEVETKGNMSRITVGMGFQSKYIVDPSTKADKMAWQERLGPKKVGLFGREK